MNSGSDGPAIRITVRYNINPPRKINNNPANEDETLFLVDCFLSSASASSAIWICKLIYIIYHKNKPKSAPEVLQLCYKCKTKREWRIIPFSLFKLYFNLLSYLQWQQHAPSVKNTRSLNSDFFPALKLADGLK